MAAELSVCCLPAATVDEILASPSLDLRVVIAARLDCQANQRRHRGGFPIGLFKSCIADPTKIGVKFFDEADRLLNPQTPAASPTKASIDANAAREIERRVDEFITSRTREQLDDLRRQAIELAVTASGKEAVMKTDPIKHHVVRMLVRTMLGGGGQQS